MRFQLRLRSIVIDMVVAFGLIVGLIASAGYLIRDLSQSLVSDARDAVWEASVPASFVYMTVHERWTRHHGVLTGLSAGAVLGPAAPDGGRWQELLGLSVYFPPDVKAAIDQANARLTAFDDAVARTLALSAEGRPADAAALAQGAQADALDALSREAASLLGTMAARISQVNARMERTAASTIAWLAILAVAAGILLSTIMATVHFRIVRPIRMLNGVMQALASGRYDVAMPPLRRKDEIGRIGETVGVFRASLIEAKSLRARQDEQRSLAETERREVLNGLAKTFETRIGKVVQSVTVGVVSLEKAAEIMSRETDAATDQAAAVASASIEATANVRRVAEAAGDLSTSMNDVGVQIRASGDGIRQTVEQATRADRDITALDEAAISVGSVAEVIGNFAAQTNLLALNATIEAARAGEAGRGFAVVAREVKDLAAKTAGATNQITSQISAIQAASAAAIARIQAIRHAIVDVDGISASVGDAIGRQVGTTALIASTVRDAAQGTERVTQSISEASVAIRNSGSLMIEVLGTARDLNRDGAALADEVRQFTDLIRAA